MCLRASRTLIRHCLYLHLSSVLAGSSNRNFKEVTSLTGNVSSAPTVWPLRLIDIHKDLLWRSGSSFNVALFVFIFLQTYTYIFHCRNVHVYHKIIIIIVRNEWPKLHVTVFALNTKNCNQHPLGHCKQARASPRFTLLSSPLPFGVSMTHQMAWQEAQSEMFC